MAFGDSKLGDRRFSLFTRLNIELEARFPKAVVTHPLIAALTIPENHKRHSLMGASRMDRATEKLDPGCIMCPRNKRRDEMKTLSWAVVSRSAVCLWRFLWVSIPFRKYT
jgi:hypothetical protein